MKFKFCGNQNNRMNQPIAMVSISKQEIDFSEKMIGFLRTSLKKRVMYYSVITKRFCNFLKAWNSLIWVWTVTESPTKLQRIQRLKTFVVDFIFKQIQLLHN